MKYASRYLASLLTLLLLALTPTVFAQSNPQQPDELGVAPVTVNTLTATLSMGNFYVVQSPPGPVTLTLPLQPAGSAVIQVKNQSQQQVTILGPIYATAPISTLIISPGGFASFYSDGTYENTNYFSALNGDVRQGILTGTVYTMSNSIAAVTGGTSSPFVQIPVNQGGWYFVFANVTMTANGATLTTQTATFYVYRTNNTPAQIFGTGVTQTFAPITTTTQGWGITALPPALVYCNGLDILWIYGGLSASTGAGSITVTGANITAVRWQ